jgi:hypothetical protein
MKKILLILFLILAGAEYQRAGVISQAFSDIHKENDCPAVGKTVKIPQDYDSIDSALTDPKNSTGKLTVNVSVKSGGYSLKDGLRIARPCTDVIGISENGKKPLLLREKFGKHEQGVVEIAASNVLLKGFELKGSFVTSTESNPHGVLILIRKDEISIKGYKTITIEDNDINTIGYKYPEKFDSCWNGDNYTCGGGYGIQIKSNTVNPIEHVFIKNNKLHNLQLGQNETITLSGNVLDFEIKDNWIHHVDNIAIDIAAFQDDCDEIYAKCVEIHGEKKIPFQPTKGVISGNKIFKLVSENNPGQKETHPWIAGIYIDGGRGTDLEEGKILIEKNLVYRFGFGIEIGSEATGQIVDNIVVKNNLLFNNLIVGIGIGHNDESQKSYVENCLIQNNTLFDNFKYTPEKMAGEFRITKVADKPFKNIIFENNLAANKTGGNRFVYGEVAPEIAKFDILFKNNLFTGKNGEFWVWNSSKLNFADFSKLPSLTLQANEHSDTFAFEKELPKDEKTIIELIENEKIIEFFKAKPFAKGRGISW